MNTIIIHPKSKEEEDLLIRLLTQMGKQVFLFLKDQCLILKHAKPWMM